MMELAGNHLLIVFTRLPRPGRAKTRLIPALGEEGAAAFHERLARHTIGRMAAMTLTDGNLRLRVVYEGGPESAMREWLGDLDYVPQGEGGLGERLQHCIRQGFDQGARSVVVIGSDCPELDASCIRKAFDQLQSHDAVFGPAKDGGYYLVGLSQPAPGLFEDIEWGGESVLEASLQRAAASGISTTCLQPLADVDLPDDLADGEAALEQGRSVSVIVPTLNDAQHLATLLPLLHAASPLEILIADGGSSDGTAELARSHDAVLIPPPDTPGRGVQMNLAAANARGEFLLFLHADTLPPPCFPELIATTMEKPGVIAGAFGFALNEPVRLGRLVEVLVGLRCKYRNLPYGDQGLFLRKSTFHDLKGFPEWPVLEDVEFIRRLRRLGQVTTLSEPAFTSARRWQTKGTLPTFLRHQAILAGYHLGFPPERLARWR